MLRISKFTNLEYYLQMEYEERQEENKLREAPEEEKRTAGQPVSAGAVAFKLLDAIVPHGLEQMLRCRHPHTGKKLAQNADSPNRQCGWVLTFNEDKTLSVESALNPEARPIIQECRHEALVKAVGFLESEACFTRRGKGGAKREHASFVAVAFNHTLSRANDPHLHTHVVVPNLAIRGDGSVGAIESRELYRAQGLANYIYQFELAVLLSARLGVELISRKNGFSIADVPKRLLIGFSKRSEEMKKHLKAGASVVAKDLVALITRPEKCQLLDQDAQDDAWAKEAAELGWQGEHWTDHEGGRPVTQEELQSLVKEAEAYAALDHREKTFRREFPKIEAQQQSEQDILRAAADDEAARKLKPVQQYDMLDQAAQGRPRKPGREEKRRISLTTGSRRVLLELMASIILRGGVISRINEEKLFPRAPHWSPASRLTIAKLRVGRFKYGATHWRVNVTSDLSVAVRDQYLFPKAPKWSPVSSWKLPAVHVQSHEH